MPKISAAERAVTSSTKNGAVLFVLFSLICSVLSSYFEGNISANLVQPLVFFEKLHGVCRWVGWESIVD